MLRRSRLLVLLGCVLLLGAQSHGASGEGAAPERIARAGKAFLATLSKEQRAATVFPFEDQAQKRRWSNLPVTMYRRSGVRLGDLTPPQRQAALAMLEAALSPSGYRKTLEIVEGDEELVRRDPSTREMFGRDEFFFSLLGEPSASAPWILQFGGHHLALNITMVGGQGTLAPSHTAAQPAVFEWEGKTVRPLGGETAKSFELMASLDERQRSKAVIGARMRDLVLGPGRDGQMIEPEGLKGSELTGEQQAKLVALAEEWIGMQHPDLAAGRLAELRKNLAETWFAWSGPTTPGSAAYFRIHGPTVFIEYAPQMLGGDPTMHLHTIYRDPTSEYGQRLIAR